jgi:hypothetical protein
MTLTALGAGNAETAGHVAPRRVAFNPAAGQLYSWKVENCDK